MVQKKSQEKSNRSSFFQRSRQSFFRSQGTRGASADILRGTSGASFEGPATINGGGNPSAACCLFLCSTGGSKKDAYVLVKGPFCFVFDRKEARSPRYAIGLQHLRATVSGDTVTLGEVCGGSVLYEMSFPPRSTSGALLFSKAVKQQAEAAKVEAVHKHVGHEHLLNCRKSVLYAKDVATQKEKQQPSMPVATSDIIDHMALTMQA